MRSIIFLLVISGLFLLPTSAFAWPGRVVAVTDGDTLVAEPESGGDRVKVRLHGIDAPERKQPYGEASRGFVIDIALFKSVEVEETARDRYGRIVAVVWLPTGESLQAELLRAGLAWVWPQYCTNCEKWMDLQRRAMEAATGLWADGNPIAPWEWRRLTH